MIAIAITFDCEAAIIFAFHDEINPKIADRHLGIDTKTAFGEHIEHLSFKG